MKALWLVTPGVESYASGDDPERGILDCPLASARLRMGVAATEWRRAGNQNIFLDPQNSQILRSIDFGEVRICAVGKFFSNLEPASWIHACSEAKRSGSRLVVDICDFPYRKRPPSVVALYDEILRICDAVVVNSERMGDLMAPHVSRRALVIEDAIMSGQEPPRFSPEQRLELLWFGHPSNLHFLRGCLNALIAYGIQRHCRLTVVTMEGYGAEELTREIDARFAPAFSARFLRWSLDVMKTAFRACDLVLIPSDPANPFKAGASANRVAEALNAGRLPIASPLPSYLPFSDAAWIGADMVEGIRWTLVNRDEALARIRRGQTLVADKLAPAVIGRQWRELFESVA